MFISYIEYFGFIFLVCKFEKEKKILKKKIVIELLSAQNGKLVRFTIPKQNYVISTKKSL